MLRRARLGIALLALALAGPIARAGAPVTAPGPKAFRVTYRTVIPAPAEGAKRLEAWIPTPYVDDVQCVRSLAVTSSVPYEATSDPATGNRFLHVLVANPRAEVTIEWVAVVERSEDAGQGRGAVRPAHLASDALASVDGRARKLAEDLGAADPKRPVGERARRIYDHVLASMAYDKEAPGWGKGDFERACDIGKGNCSDFAAKFIAIARAAGIPARWVSTISLAGEHRDCSACGYHCYAHFRDGDRWIPVDVSEAQKVLAKDPAKAAWFFGHLDADRVSLTVGRDVDYAPKQAGDPALFIVYPYCEVDGKAVEVPKENRSFTWEGR
jgi:transglutaminase-like putative cysteine protease